MSATNNVLPRKRLHVASGRSISSQPIGTSGEAHARRRGAGRRRAALARPVAPFERRGSPWTATHAATIVTLMPPLVSVLLPYRQAEATLDEALESVLA